jgi:hypothetical protein
MLAQLVELEHPPRRGVRQPRVEPVVAQASGDVGVPFGPVVQVIPRQPGELGVAAHQACVSRSR